jgi:mannose-6-phosphate isomerase-like protein (cupin superfamily)
MSAVRLGAALALLVAAPLPAQTTAPARFVAQIAAMAKAMKPGQGFAWQPLVQADGDVAALEIWKKPGRPAVHPAQAEYVIVVDGAGTMISGGTLADAKANRPDLTEGSRIVGGTTRTLKPGDVFLVPAGVPHWFGITGDRLVLLGTKLPAAR